MLDRVKSLAHITGGSFAKNVPRALAEDVSATLDATSWTPPPLFGYIQEHGRVDDAEMFNVFNMGVGMIAVVAPADVDVVLSEIEGAWIIGETSVRKAGGEQVIWLD